MNNRNFSEWLSGFRDSIADYGYYIDFDKVHRRCFFILMKLSLLFWKCYKHNRAVIRAFFNFYCTLVEQHNFPNKR